MSADVAITTVTSILIITSILGNSIVCFVITRNRDMRIPINYLLVNLAVADIMYSTFYIPVLVFIHIYTHPEGVTGKVLCVIRNGILAWIGATSSIFTLAAIAVERYYAVIHPYGNKGKLTTRKLKVIIPGSWIFSLILTFPEFLRLDFVKEIDPNFCTWPEQWIARVDSLVWYVFSLLSITLLAGLYTRVVYTLWFKHNDGNDLAHQQQGVLKVRKRVTLMVVIVSVVFGVCWGTDAILHLLEDVGSFKLSPVAIPLAHTVIMFNAAVNPFAYALINHRFREKMKGILSCSFRVHAARTPQDIELANDNTQPTNTMGTTQSDALEVNFRATSFNPTGQDNLMVSVVTSKDPSPK